MIPEYPIVHFVISFIVVAIVMLGAMLLISWLLRPIKRRPEAEQTYECGIAAEGEHRGIGFNYINYATLFLIFDVAALYLFLYSVLPNTPQIVTVSFMLGLATLFLIIFYGTKKGKYYVA